MAVKPKSKQVETTSETKANIGDHERLSISDRRSPELVIAMVGAVGSGVSVTAEILAKKLREDFNYKVNMIQASDKIKENAKLANEKYDDKLCGGERIKRLQIVGNKLRDKFSNNYIIEKCIEQIATDRLDEGYDKYREPFVALPQRQVHIIDSVKHPDEVKLLRDVYGDVFWLFSVFAPEEVRKERLSSNKVDDAEISKIFSTDENEGSIYGQKVRDTTQLADFFIRNDGQNHEELDRVIDRYLEILFNIKVHTPTLHEAAMYNAVAASSKSACLSRQVGAAIYSKDGELISVGWNDVPKAFGGLYGAEDGMDDHRCFLWGGKICHNDDRKENLYNSVYDKLSQEGLLSEKTNAEVVRNALVKTEIKNLIEYSRSVHAEMEAIISAARDGKIGLVGGRLYCTTFPCHSCARHIVASGITEVYYIEPYAKSLAPDLHKDSVSKKYVNKENRMVIFLQYEGVAPKNMIRLFKHGVDRKKDGKVVTVNKKDADPVFCPAMDGFTTYEKMIVADLHQKESMAI